MSSQEKKKPDSGADMVQIHHKQLEAIQIALQQLHYSLTNWMEVADEEDQRAYDRKAVRHAQKVYRDVFGRELAGDEKPA